MNFSLKMTKPAFHSVMLIISICKEKERRCKEMLLCYLFFIITLATGFFSVVLERRLVVVWVFFM